MTDQFLWFQLQMNNYSRICNTPSRLLGGGLAARIVAVRDLYDEVLARTDCHSWWISKMQSGRDDTLEERYAIKFCFKLGKNAATETYGMLQTAFRPSCMNRAASVFEWHKRFKEDRGSVRDNERCGRSKEVNRPELIGQRFRVRVTMLKF